MRLSSWRCVPSRNNFTPPGGFARAAAVVAPLLLAIAILSCGGGDSPSGPGDTAKGAIAVSANVSGAAIALNGVDTGKTTDATLSDLDAGSYVVSVSLANHTAVPSSITVTVESGKTASAVFTLTQVNQGFIAVTADRAGALIYLDGAATSSTTPDTLTGVTPGDHTVRVELAGFEPSPVTIDLSVAKDSVSDAAFDLASAPQSRKIFLEHFSNTSCLPCYDTDLALEGAINALGHQVVASVGTHLNWPSPGDPFYLGNPEQNIERGVNQFGVSYLPEVHVDGEKFNETEDEDSLKAWIVERTGVDPQFDIAVTGMATDDSFIVSGSVHMREAPAGSPLLYVVIIERGIDYDAANGLDFFDDVARRYLPGMDGESLDMAVGESRTYRYAWPIAGSWVAANLEAVVFIESATSRDVYQCASTHSN